MSAFDPDQAWIANPELRELLSKNQAEEAISHGERLIASGLSDVGLLEAIHGRLDTGVGKIRTAMALNPDHRPAFHNLLVALLHHHQLRGQNLTEAQKYLLEHFTEHPWMRQYGWLLNMPTFINFEFVRGRCNLRCRMCISSHAKEGPRELEALSADSFAKALSAAPTIGGLTLSSGDSDPLLHPEFESILETATKHQVGMDLYTNGHALTARLARRFVESRCVGMMNFSLDAATPETYRRIRGASLDRVRSKIEMLRSMREEVGTHRPSFSFNFVAMADNIEELPDFVRMAKRLGAARVCVGDLIGWLGSDEENRVATENPRWRASVAQARAVAEEEQIALVLPARLTEESEPSHDEPETPRKEIEVCGWITGVWIRMKGDLEPCCSVHRVADMGSVHDGALWANPKYNQVKDLLRQGKVFPACLRARGCEFVQQCRARGEEPPVITREELGPLWLDEKGETPVDPTEAASELSPPAETVTS